MLNKHLREDIFETRNVPIHNGEYCIWSPCIHCQEYLLSAIRHLYTVSVIDVKAPILQILTHDLKLLQDKGQGSQDLEQKRDSQKLLLSQAQLGRCWQIC